MAFGFFRNNSGGNQANNMHGMSSFGRSGAHSGGQRWQASAGRQHAHPQGRQQGAPPQRQMPPGQFPQQRSQMPYMPQTQPMQQMPQKQPMQPMQQMQQMPPQGMAPPAQPRRPQSSQQGSHLPKMTQNSMENPFNAPLPDGVKLVPLDENTMKNLHSIGVDPPPALPGSGGTSTPSGSSALPVPPKPLEPEAGEAFAVKPGSTAEILANFIQNERNGVIFYEKLTKKAPSKELRGLLENIVGNCEHRREKLGKAYQQQRGEDFTPEQADIELVSVFGKGLRRAIIQETSTVQELCRMCESATDQGLAKLLTSQLYSKIADIAVLTMMLSSG